ncbi:hypothetical protein PQX77_017762 [Marasmius sp. AFHP31]|nr:hypothetical protein PQX77_017762 [Marasmius sp. AFHP31]
MDTTCAPAFTFGRLSVNTKTTHQPTCLGVSCSNQPFTVGCFSVDTETAYQSTCHALSFNNERLMSWFKAHAAIEKRISASEADGCIYVFWVDGVDFRDVTDIDLTNTSAYKVGRTTDPQRREHEWQRQCPSQKHTWFTPIWVKDCHCVERLVHIELERICVEIFLVSNTPDAIEKLISLIKEQDRVAQLSPKPEV